MSVNNTNGKNYNESDININDININDNNRSDINGRDMDGSDINESDMNSNNRNGNDNNKSDKNRNNNNGNYNDENKGDNNEDNISEIPSKQTNSDKNYVNKNETDEIQDDKILSDIIEINDNSGNDKEDKEQITNDILEQDLNRTNKIKEKSDIIATDKSSNDKKINQTSDTDKSSFGEKNKDTPSESVELDNNSNPIKDIIILDEAKKRASIANSFRQLNKFRYANKVITFTFFGLVTKNYKANTQISIMVNLIKISGEMEEFERKAECIIASSVNIIEGYSAQAEFKCELNDLKEDYYSFRFNHSDFISGIPTDEILLNPELTYDSIKLGKIYDYSNADNKVENKLPSTFTSLNIKENNVPGELIIEGTLNKDVKNRLKFNLRLTYPEEVSMLCSLTSFEAGPSSIICKTDRDINSEPVIIEQTITTYENYEILVITSIISEKNINCENGLLREAEEKIKNGISFRQVSNLLYSDEQKEFSFILEGILSEKYKEGFNFILNVIISIDIYKREKDSNCTLQNSTTIKNNFDLGYFKCVTKVTLEEYTNIDFKKAESVTISPYNTNITGVFGFDKNKLSPILKKTITNDNITLDFPTFQPKKLVKIEQCWKKGKFRIIGVFSDEFKEKTFEFPLSFPSGKVIKCKVEEVDINKESEIICKLQSEFKDVKSLIFESRIVTKMNKEILFIEKNIFKDISISCQNYNKIKFEKAKQNQKASFSFVTMSKINPSGNTGLFTNFFIGMVRKTNKNYAEFKFPVNIRYSPNSLRQLDESEILANCTIATQKGTTVFYECISETKLSSKLLQTSVDYDTIENNIAGLPESVDPSKLNCPLDYSYRDNLDVINKLPIITIKNINYCNCTDSGYFTIKGIIDKEISYNNDNIEIQFSYPDSSSICNIQSESTNVIMNCKNKEKFPISTIMFDQIYIKDNDGNILFKLNNYINQKQFACEVGILEYNIQSSSSSSSSSTSSSSSSSPSSSSSSSPLPPPKPKPKSSDSKSILSKFYIIIVIIVIIFIIALVIYCYYKNSGKKPLTDDSISDVNSLKTISQISYSN